MIGPGVSGVDAASVPRSVQVEGGKINVGKMIVNAEKKAAPNTPEAVVQQQDAEIQKAALELTKRLVEEARTALAKSGETGRNALKLVSGNEAIVNHLWGQRDAEYLEASMIKDLKEQSQRYTEIQKRYEKLIQYAENRQNETRLNISRLKKSENPNDKALAIDVENASAELDLRSYDETILNIQLILKTGLNPRTNLPLEKSVRDHYSAKLSSIYNKRDLLAKTTKDSKEARINMKDAQGNPIRDVIKDMVTVLSGKEQENPMAFLERRMGQALTSEAAMGKFADELVNIKMLNGEDKKKFVEDMALGLSWKDRVDTYRKTGQSVLMTLMSLGGLLAYVAAQKTLREGAGMQG